MVPKAARPFPRAARKQPSFTPHRQLTTLQLRPHKSGNERTPCVDAIDALIIQDAVPILVLRRLLEDEAQFRAPTYSSLRTIIINCGFYGDALSCNEDRSQPSNKRDLSYPRARTTLVRSLRELVLRDAFPNIERLWLLDGIVKVNPTNEREPSAWNRRDVARNKTWAMPWTTLHGGNGWPLRIIRLPDGQELITANHTDMAVLAEGQTWKETITGTRLPTPISDDLEKGKHLMKDAPTISLSGYRKISPRGSCTWWIQDARTGTTTVSATEREGLLDRSLVHATTPPGWTWELLDAQVGCHASWSARPVWHRPREDFKD